MPQILINKQLVMDPHEWDYFYEGPSDDAVIKIAQDLNWDLSQ